jgi:hypothetical protein
VIPGLLEKAFIFNVIDSENRLAFGAPSFYRYVFTGPHQQRIHGSSLKVSSETAMNDATKAQDPNSSLVNYALKGLERCWLRDSGCWSAIYHLDGRSHPNESRPVSDVFYTLNVLLGYARVAQLPSGMNVADTFRRNALRLLTLPVPMYAYGMVLWAAAELDLPVPEQVLTHIKATLTERGNWRAFRAQDLGMLLTGVVAQARRDPDTWSSTAYALFAFLLERFYCKLGLFFDAAYGMRRWFGSFATQTYLTLACYAYGEFAKNGDAIDMANAAVGKLIARQGPNGEWPWFFHVPSATVVDFYEIYVVHQYGMAPAFLERAEHHGVAEARGALIKGFRWVLGENPLRRPMLVPELHLSIRSHVRDRELHTKMFRVARAVGNGLLRHRSKVIDPKRVQLRLECRSYELGWILWSFGQRNDLPELTEHRIFRDQVPV